LSPLKIRNISFGFSYFKGKYFLSDKDALRGLQARLLVLKIKKRKKLLIAFLRFFL